MPEELPPTPIVRAHPLGEGYIAIDGHNLIAVLGYLGQQVTVYVAESAHDGLPDDTSSAVATRNAELAAKYEIVVADAMQAATAGVATFQDLEHRYPELFPALV